MPLNPATIEAFRRSNGFLLELAEGLDELNGSVNDGSALVNAEASVLGYALLAIGFTMAAQNFSDALNNMLTELKSEQPAS